MQPEQIAPSYADEVCSAFEAEIRRALDDFSAASEEVTDPEVKERLASRNYSNIFNNGAFFDNPAIEEAMEIDPHTGQITPRHEKFYLHSPYYYAQALDKFVAWKIQWVAEANATDIHRSNS